MNELTPFLFENAHTIRAGRPESGELMFVGVDICRVLEIKKHERALETLDSDERGTLSMGTPGGVQTVIGVTEPGCYRLVFKSRKPVAERLKRWLAHEVIPSIRRTGRFESGGSEVIPPADRAPFPEWPMDEMRTKRGVADMYRLVYGVGAAQWIIPQLGFPLPPKDLIEHNRQLDMFRPDYTEVDAA